MGLVCMNNLVWPYQFGQISMDLVCINNLVMPYRFGQRSMGLVLPKTVWVI